ncbi:hypothetical protein [Maliponia aquimaris]|uniref:Cytochrome c domain-containing protein n=1 Tax=Maliponia aquimaris TaxID=1673631 RepID=A0A238KE82_9RHOB|nr:hypothetical protein [Maliponia aquimaris]SMX41123.1 hypothetical protein MAA8898_02384 [Maliponia aquimaris]
MLALQLLGFVRRKPGNPVPTDQRNSVREGVRLVQAANAPTQTGALSDKALRGRGLFTGKAGCIACHNGGTSIAVLASHGGDILAAP